jgi:hypothetical protein
VVDEVQVEELDRLKREARDAEQPRGELEVPQALLVSALDNDESFHPGQARADEDERHEGGTRDVRSWPE